MTQNELVEALASLGELLPEKAQVVIAGGAALILGGYIDRGTADGDVVHAEPPLAQLRSAIVQVAHEKGLSPDWLNDGVKGFSDVLPEDFEDRTDRMGTFGNLRVLLLGRLDLILSKFYGGREVDLQDLAEMRPTSEEIAFVLSQLDRIAQFRPDKALRMKLYLEQGGDAADLSDSRPPEEGEEHGEESHGGGIRRGGP